MTMENLIEIHKKCKIIFEKQLIEPDGGRSFACKIWDVMTEKKDNHENCLGENFNQLIQTINDDFFENYTPSISTKLDFYFTTYILWLYLIVERIDFVFDVVNKDNKSKLFADFKENNFKTSQLIKKWANFIKHPKEFIFSHWPQYIMEGPEIMNGSETVIIDADFVKKHYTKSDSRINELENCDSVIVLVPELANLTTEFCKELNTFFDFICDNKIVSDFLRKKTTLEYYYETNDTQTADEKPSH
jgi:hypothetical protein